jgi:hypothetical protein
MDNQFRRTATTTQLGGASGRKKKSCSLIVGIIVGLELYLFMACHTMAVHAFIRPRCVHAGCAFLGRPSQAVSLTGASSRLPSNLQHLKVMYYYCVQRSLQPILSNKNNIFHNTKQYSTTAISTTQLQAGFTNINESNWQSFSKDLEETLELPSISVPAKHIHWLLSNKESPIRPYLAHTMDEFEGIHPKIKVVRDCENKSDDEEEEVRKLILLSSDDLIPDDTFQTLVDKFHARTEDKFIIHIPHHQQPVTRVLSKLLPEEAQPPPSSYEQVGHVVHINLKTPHVQYGKLIGSILLDRLQPATRTIVNKVGEVGGPFRTYQMDLLAGEDDYLVHVVEHGVSLYFDLRNVYWCTRLEGERTYMLENEFQPNQIIADAFCGVGAQLIRAAKKVGCRIVANDLNPGMYIYDVV